ncbi:MAG: M24 family metallopeptidase [Planctomycetaceae bacterium]
MFDISKVQSALREFKLDGWLLYDFRGSNVLARRVLGLDHQPTGSRRWLYFIPASGTPRKLVHRIETGALDNLPGDAAVYLRWQGLDAGIQALVQGCQVVAMEYSPGISNPYVSRVDAGVVELVRSADVNVVSSGDLVQLFEALWDDDQWAMHQAVGVHTDSAYALAWKFIAEEIRRHGSVTELAVQQAIMAHFERHELTTYSPPIVAVNEHSGDPHYETGTAAIRSEDFVLIDLWAKLKQPRAVYSDLTRVGYVGDIVPEKFVKVFNIVAAARDAAIHFIRKAFAEQRPLPGWQVDDACRAVIEQAGYGQYFVHRTGHSIGQEVHGNGANIDNLETHEERLILPGACFSIEPGIYLPEFGVRCEVDVFIDRHRQVHVTAGEPQREIVRII